MRISILSFIAFILLVSCSEPELEGTEEAFSSLSSEQTGIKFTNEISNTKDLNIFNYRNFYNGGGVGIGDVNNDGLMDIYLTSNQGSNKLYINKGNLSFEDVTAQAGVALGDKWSTGVSMVDINNDGNLDIYVSNAGYKKGLDQRNSLFINKGDLKFEDQAEEYGLDENGYTTHASFFDYDLDGDLDLYLLNNSFIPVNTLNYSNKRDLPADEWDVKEFLKGGGDKFYKNEGGKFTDVSKQVGIYQSLIGFGLGVTVSDLNGDHYPDIYVSNDFFERDYLYINNQDGTFSEELTDRADHISHSSMGADIGDINNDGNPEIFVTDMLPDDDYRLKTTSNFDNVDLRALKESRGFYHQYMQNTLQLNDGKGAFDEIAFFAGVSASDWSWGALFLDYDNDGFNDIYVSNGIYKDVTDQDFIDFFANEVMQEMVLNGQKEELQKVIDKMPSTPIKNKLFRNAGNLTFEDESKHLKSIEPSFSNGAAYVDLDNDGDLEIVVNNVNQEATVLKNHSKNHYIAFSLAFQKDNLNAIGAEVNIYYHDTKQSKSNYPYRGFQSSVDQRLYFGLGQEAVAIDSVSIVWPNLTKSTLTDPSIDSLYQISYDGFKPMGNITDSDNDITLFNEVKHSFDSHKEDDYQDFYYERNILSGSSHEGPCMSMSSNGKSPFLYIGGAAEQSGQLYKYQSGKFVKSQIKYFEKFAAFEDTDAVFLDVDNDGDDDLIVASGGNNATYIPRAFRDRFYRNNDGIFEIEFNALPNIASNTSCIRPHDFDNDGDLDLFVGSHGQAGQYGVSAGSHLYANNGQGKFIDVTNDMLSELLLAGRGTDAVWSNILGEEEKELIIVGDWMAPKVMSFNGYDFQIVPTKLDSFSGFWKSIAVVDLNEDGYNDLLLGNIGDNFYLEASDESPLLLWLNDFDQNGVVDPIISYRIDKKDYPVVMKKNLTDQLPFLKKQSLKHADYATKTIHELFDPALLKASNLRRVNYTKSVACFNRGNGNFDVNPLPVEAQLSCINSFAVRKEEGETKIHYGGNQFYFFPQFSRLDAFGLETLSYNNEKFEYVSPSSTGLYAKGLINNINLFELSSQTYLLALINDSSPKLFRLNEQ